MTLLALDGPHVAELITASRKPTAKRAAVAEERVVETILKLWSIERRFLVSISLGSIQGDMELFSKLTPDANPWHCQAKDSVNNWR